MEARLYDKYVTEVVPALQQKFGYKNVNQIPKIDKIVINMGLGDCKDNPKALEAAVKELEAIAGQKAITTKAKKSIAKAFRLQMEGKGFTMIEVLSTCPTNWGLSPVEAMNWLEQNMIPYYPLGVYKDKEAK